MIESAFPGGSGGGTVETITAGTGITVNSTDPANPIITNTSLNTDEVAKVSSNDTTAGYLNGKLVAGSGIALTENNNGGNETLGIAVNNLDAAAIATGTIATARLGTGTANSSTYLAGDQTYKTAVTSVNGATGAVVIGAGDTTYPMTIADAENTNNLTSLITFTVPANTWLDGEILYVDYLVQYNNTTGLQPSNLTSGISINGFNQGTSSEQLFQNNSRTVRRLQPLWRNGTTLNVPRFNTSHQFNTIWGGNPINSGDQVFNQANYTQVANPFGSDIIVRINATWDNANPTVWARVLNARAYKPSGQKT
jgi:hypothetical protein